MKTRKLISFLMAFVMICSIVCVTPTTVSAANYTCTMTLEELQTIFEDGKYWNHIGLDTWDLKTTTSTPCTSVHKHGNCKYSGSCGCNSFNGKCIQCMGFAYACQYLTMDGFDGYSASENWDYTDAMVRLKPGDVIRYYIGGVKHSIFVTKVDGDTITYMDCNGTGGGCIIRQNQTISKSSLKSVFVYATHAPVELVSNAANRISLVQTAVVTAKTTLIVRENPGVSSAKIGSLKSGATVQVTGYPITDNSGLVWRRLLTGGWVCGSYLHITSNNEYLVSGTYRIQNENGKFLSYVTNPANDVNIVMYDELKGTDLEALQQWNFQPVYYNNATGDIAYRITPVLNSKFSLDCDSTQQEALHLWDTLDIGAQIWWLHVRADNSLMFINDATSFCLDVKNASSQNNAEVITYESNNSIAQMFYIVAP